MPTADGRVGAPGSVVDEEVGEVAELIGGVVGLHLVHSEAEARPRGLMPVARCARGRGGGRLQVS